MDLEKIDILGVGVTNEKEDKILEFILRELAKPKSKRQKVVIFTPNPEQISQASGNPELRHLLNRAQIALPDGMGVVWASRLIGRPIEARITGVDFMKKLLFSVSKQPVNTGYLGGQRGIAEKTAECLRKKHPELKISYASDTYNREKMIESDIDILFVAFGFPKQEQWIMEHKDEIPATIIMGVGGAFDFISGKVARAPKVLRSFGFEWLFRLIIQPWRFWRQLQIWRFGGLIFLRALSDRQKRPKI